MITLEEFIEKFRKIKEMGWIKTHRSGNTGIGKTLEDLLGIQENNIQAPDFGIYELKSARKNSTSMLTIFTKSPEPQRANELLRQKYGYCSAAYKNNEKVLHSTLNAVKFTPIANTGDALKVTCMNDKIHIESKNNGIEQIYWSRNALKKIFEKKLQQIVYVKAESRGSGKNEEFWYNEAYLLGGFNWDSFVELLEKGKIYIDLRIGQYPDGRIHDHGTGFRIQQKDFDLLFQKREKLV